MTLTWNELLSSHSLFLQNEDENAHSRAKDKEMTCVDKQTQDHKQLFDTQVTRS